MPKQGNPSLYRRLVAEHSLFSSAVRNYRARLLQDEKQLTLSNVEKAYGTHVIATYELDQLPELEDLQKMIERYAEKAGATVMASKFFHTHHSSKKGISGGIVISESHVIVHIIPYPTKYIMMIDAYTCGDKLDPNPIIISVVDELKNVSGLTVTYCESIDFKRGLYAKDQDRFVPGIAVARGNEMLFFASANETKPKTHPNNVLATHVVGELYCSDPGLTNNGDILLDIIYQALIEEGMDTRTKIKFHNIIKFVPQGVSVVLMGDGIQITTHPWPELPDNIAPFDIFMLKKHNVNPVRVMERIAQSLQSQKYRIYEFERGVYNEKLEAVPVLENYKPAVI